MVENRQDSEEPTASGGRPGPMNTKRLCVFCGNKPEERTKEHIFPRWLLALTGDPKRIAKFPLFSNPGREHSWDQFVFPACSKCNSDYAEIEGRAKAIVQSLLEFKDVSNMELACLMEWVDKLRIGTWLSYYILEGRDYGITPHFHINKRAGNKDSLIAIGRTKEKKQLLKFFPFNDPVFLYSPSFFMLQVNWINIVSVSTDWLIAKTLGLPYYEITEYHADGSADAVLKEGSNIAMPFHRFGSKYRVLYRVQYLDKLPTEYASQHSKLVLDFDKSGTLVFMEKRGKLIPSSHNRSVDWCPKMTPSMRHLVNNGILACIAVRRKFSSALIQHPLSEQSPNFKETIALSDGLFDQFSGFPLTDHAKDYTFDPTSYVSD